MATLTSIVFRAMQETTHAQTPGHLEGAMPHTPPVRLQVFVDLCTSVGRQERNTPPQTHRDVVQVLQAIAVAQAEGDMFTLRWFTFVCLWICPQLRRDVQINASPSVTRLFFDGFPAVMRASLFQADCVKTPLEIVAHLMILLRISYDSI
jgi:hypothetical protein